MEETPGPLPAIPRAGAATLASDRDRDLMVERLSAACADGRLELSDFSERVERALAARTVAELDQLGSDLGEAPRPLPEPGREPWLIGIMSQSQRRGHWLLPPRCNALALMGECVLDLTRAEVSSSQSEVRAVAIMGSVKVIVPEGIEVDLDGVNILGTKIVRGSDAAPLRGAPRIRISAVVVMGEVSVVTVPPDGQPGPGERLGAEIDRHLRRAQSRALRHLERRDRRRSRWGGS